MITVESKWANCYLVRQYGRDYWSNRGDTVDEVEAFHRFAIGRLRGLQENVLTLDDLLNEWESVTNRDEINAAIREGIADVNAGRTRSVREFNAELREKYKLGK